MKFNNELWRIIGILDGKVKLIRNESTGLSNAAKEMIEESTWYLGGWNSSEIKEDIMYGKEGGNTVYSGRSTSWEGYVGLIYLSDYGYAASSSCSDTMNLDRYASTACTSNNCY